MRTTLPAAATVFAVLAFAFTPQVPAAAPDIREPGRLADEVEALVQRKSLVEDNLAVKRLQRAWGYYLDEALWDEVADLFADDATLEMGLDGVYVGKRRIREYLYARGNGKAGLAPGQLDEHMQLMPVITVAPDGNSARGTWRDLIMTGQLGKDAFWGEGPFENEYVKQNGVWKISKLHWYQTLVTPFEGGWAVHEDVNGGKYVSTRLPPDRPPSVNYAVWPGAFTPPFHFLKSPGPAPGAAPNVAVTPQRLSARQLASRAATLARDLQRLQDTYDIENLQRIYGYYVDKSLWTQAADLFAADGSIEIAGRGTFIGRDRVLAYLNGYGPEFPQEGRLFDQMQLQPIVHVAADGRTAKGRWHVFTQAAQAGRFHEWGVGVYENDYVKEGGVWKISKLHSWPTMFTPYDEGWGKTAQAQTSFEPQLAPDRAAKAGKPTDYRNVFVVPFHYAHPVKARQPALPAVRSSASLDAVASSLADSRRRLGLLEDTAQIENLQGSYGYYLATLEWDALTALFADDGTIEIALRGIYVGKASVRRNLNLYGNAGLDNGVLHNHMQFQPVIHVAADGQTARIRSRAFSMMGNSGRSGLWMAGIYENELVKVNGVWKFHKDQVMNTYFAPYNVGWKTLASREAPGITASNPPDRPPSFHFDMYPKVFLPPYHYDNPVTGRPAVWPPAR